MLVYPEQNSIIIAHFKGCKRITAGNTCRQNVSLRTFKQALIQGYQWQGRKQCLFLPEVAGNRLHVLGQQQLLHFIGTPFQFFQAVCSNCDKDIHVIEILIGSQTFL